MKIWSVQEAKARFSELLKVCLLEGPQIVTKRGAEAAADGGVAAIAPICPADAQGVVAGRYAAGKAPVAVARRASSATAEVQAVWGKDVQSVFHAYGLGCVPCLECGEGRVVRRSDGSLSANPSMWKGPSDRLAPQAERERNSESAGGNISRVSWISVWNTGNSGINSHAILNALQ